MTKKPTLLFVLVELDSCVHNLMYACICTYMTGAWIQAPHVLSELSTMNYAYSSTYHLK